MLRVLLLVLTGVLALAPASPGLAQSTVRIGAVLPLTGSQAAFGQASLNGIQLAVDLINEAGGVQGLNGAKLEVIVADAGSDPTTAASVTQRLVSQNRVVAVLGAFASSLSLAASEVTERNRVPFLTMSFTDILTQRGFRYLFQVVPKGTVIGAAQLRYAVEIGQALGRDVRRVAIVFEDTAYGSSNADGLVAEAQRLGLEVVLNEPYPAGLTDATPVVQKIRNARPDMVFPVSYFTDAVLIIRSMRQAGLNIPVVGGAAGYVIPEFYDALGEYAEGILSINTSNYDHYGELGRLYRERHGQFMTHEAFEHAVLVYALVEAINQARSADPARVTEALRSLELTTYPVSGLPGGGIRFDETGLNVMTYPIMVQWQNGELVTVWPASDALGQPLWPE